MPRSASVAAALAVTMAWYTRRAVRGVVVGIAIVAVVGLSLVPGVVRWVNPQDSTGRSLHQSTKVRHEMAWAALRMSRDFPVFGVGQGMFQTRSGAYIDPAFRSTVPAENAHNNYLQVLAELGAVGFLLAAWTVLGVVVPRVRSARRSPADAAAAGAMAGLLAFALTAIAGHPLLIFEVAVAFWLTLGAFVNVEPRAEGAGTGR